LPDYAPVDDDYYYEMVAVRAFEKYGIGLTVEQLGQQWLENNAGSWGSSEQALLLLKRGVSRRTPSTLNTTSSGGPSGHKSAVTSMVRWRQVCRTWPVHWREISG
jgi:hypothetical protein